MIYYLLNSLIIGVLFVDFLERKFPNYFNNLLFNASYNCIYYYSKLQITFGQAKNKLNLFIENTPILLKIKNDINQLKFYFHDEIFQEITIDYCNGFDFYIYNYIDNNCVNKSIYYNTNSNVPLFELSNIKFMLVEFNFNDKDYKIDLKTDVFNYYLVGNKFTKDFFIYYIKNHYNENIDKNTCNKCSVKIIDHNVNNIELNLTENNESILINKDDYIILH
jgi:hypothetical protein